MRSKQEGLWTTCRHSRQLTVCLPTLTKSQCQQGIIDIAGGGGNVPGGTDVGADIASSSGCGASDTDAQDRTLSAHTVAGANIL